MIYGSELTKAQTLTRQKPAAQVTPRVVMQVEQKNEIEGTVLIFDNS